MNKYNVIVKKPGKIIFFNNRKIRSPFTLEIHESEINLLKSAMVAGAITESQYSIELITDDDVQEETWEDVIIPEKEEVVIEDLVEEKEPKTLLEKLLRDDENGE